LRKFYLRNLDMEEAAMVRKIILTVALALTASLYVLAQSGGVPATFILTDGQRKSGSMGFYGDKHENFIGGYLGLDTPAGRERFKIEQVAIVDFAGGAQPSQNELNALPPDGSVIVLKNGQTNKGKLLNFVSGNVQWQNEGGQTQQYAISDVDKVILNANAARHALNVTGASTPAVGTAGAAPGAIQVAGNRQWTDSGITVKAGDRVAFSTSGQITFAPNNQTAGPDGSGTAAGQGFPVPQMAVGGLIGRVGNSAPFPIGSNTQPITMPASGRLVLGINDNIVADNSGSFSVTVTKQ
jgi:hypothetical protein